MTTPHHNNPPPEDGPWFPINAYRSHGFEAGRYWINAAAKVYDLTTRRYLGAGYRKSKTERGARRHQKYMRVQPRNAEDRQVSCLLHVLLWYAANPNTPWDGYEVDHKDSDTSNNALYNLIALQRDKAPGKDGLA